MSKKLVIMTPELIVQYCNHEINSRYLSELFGCTQTSVCRALKLLNNPEINAAMTRNVPRNLQELSDVSVAKYPEIDRMILAGEKVDYISFVLKVSAFTVTKRRKALGLQGVKGKDIIARKNIKENAVA